MNENEENKVERVELGVCPVCGKGKIIKGSIGYSCNYFKSIDDKCEFNIYTSYYDKVITDEIALQLIEKKETDVFHDLRKKDETIFSASFKIEDGRIKTVFHNHELATPCPVCNGKVVELLTGFACENYTKRDEEDKRACGVFIPKTICEKAIPQDVAEMLLNGKQSPLIVGFKKKDGSEFESRLVLNQELNVSFTNNLCNCPKCGSGLIYVGQKAYNCSNFKDEAIKCDFTIWREMLGRKISEEEAIQLCQNKETDVLTGFKKKDESAIERKLVINEEFKVVLA